MRKSLFLAAVVLFLAARLVHADVIAPNVSIAGKSQLEHTHLWWQVMSNLPAAVNPTLDTTGEFALNGQVDDLLYLGGSFVGPTTRTFTVAPGTTFFVPIINAFADNTAASGDPPGTLTAQQLLDIITFPQANVVSLSVTIDGVIVATTAELLNHQITTDPNNPFANVIQSPSNLLADFGLDASLGTGVFPATIDPTVLDGFWVGLEPFAPGTTHTVRLQAEVNHPVFGLITQDNTFNITVAPVPEPMSLCLWGVVFPAVGLAGAHRRAKRKRAGV